MKAAPEPVARPKDAAEIKVFISSRKSTCDECRSALGRYAWIVLTEGKRALCLSCADLDHLEFLPSGDPAVTRRAKKGSTLWAVVLKWSRARYRYERQGLLVEEKALEDAEAACFEDAAARAARAKRRAERDADVDRAYIARFARAVRERYPNCPPGREHAIAEHACRKYSGRIGRTSSAKSLEESAVDLAVRAHARHTETKYDALLANGSDRSDARRSVGAAIDEVLKRWSH